MRPTGVSGGSLIPILAAGPSSLRLPRLGTPLRQVLMVLLRTLHEAGPGDSPMDKVVVRRRWSRVSGVRLSLPPFSLSLLGPVLTPPFVGCKCFVRQVVSFTEDVPNRAYPQWSSYYVNVPVLEAYDGAEADTCALPASLPSPLPSLPRPPRVLRPLLSSSGLLPF